MCKCWAYVSFSHRALRLAQSNYFVNECVLSIAIRFCALHAVRVYVRVMRVSELLMQKVEKHLYLKIQSNVDGVESHFLGKSINIKTLRTQAK